VRHRRTLAGGSSSTPATSSQRAAAGGVQRGATTAGRCPSAPRPARPVSATHGWPRRSVACARAWSSRALKRVSRLSNSIAPLAATVLVPSPWSTLISRCFAAARWATWAMHACHSDPSAARFVKTVSTVVSWMAGLPRASVGTAKPCHGLPVERPHTLRCQTREEPRVHVRPHRGIARRETIQPSHSGAERWAGIGAIAGVGAVTLLRQGPHTGPVDACERINVHRR
jgi:hypothetical protein